MHNYEKFYGSVKRAENPASTFARTGAHANDAAARAAAAPQRPRHMHDRHRNGLPACANRIAAFYASERPATAVGSMRHTPAQQAMRSMRRVAQGARNVHRHAHATRSLVISARGSGPKPDVQQQFKARCAAAAQRLMRGNSPKSHASVQLFSSWEGSPLAAARFSTLFRLGKDARKPSRNRMQRNCIFPSPIR